MDLERIEGLLKLMHEYSVAELELSEEEDGIHLRLMEGTTVAAVAAAPVVQGSAAPSSVEPVQHLADNALEVKSPMVGTFYRSPKPGSPSFVKVGDRVDVGQVLCIVEAMKLMNELEAEVSGTVSQILVDNEQPVQFGQVLFHIQPD